MKTVIGLEIHAQLLTETKAFCTCEIDVNAKPNTNICPVCTGQPGALPVLNKKAVEFAIMAGLALNCEIHEISSFDRKNYFYPDLPKGYQITQYFHPIATEGYLNLDNGKHVRIRRIHIEEDAGKMVHSSENITESKESLIDFNRCGVPLIEIVTEPDMEKSEEAKEFMEKLRDILRTLGVCSGNMEEGALRCDANVSVVDDNGRSSSRVEVKNINSFRYVQYAIEYEAERISKALKDGKDVKHETRGWNFVTRTTVSLRSKEEENDYRYFPEPDLPILKVSKSQIENIKQNLPELPDQKSERYVKTYGLAKDNANIIAKDKIISAYFEKLVSSKMDPKDSSNWIVNDLLALFNADSVDFNPDKVPIESLKVLMEYTNSGKISRLSAKEILGEIYKNNNNPQDIIKEKNLIQVSDENSLVPVIKKVIENNPSVVEQYKKGKTSVVGFFVGNVMKETKGKADPKVVGDLAKKILDGEIK
ncbi:MAG: Asp-tRNA(Asn)/Glu-tRNA(Gln) amidotransferase subunit GatB [Thermotogae bacterium]|jgi:aspartyl-tRNA(Asn)/glutamyl-tRNA(Gln) amidotransferase subunit B|nr:Asp-tRNA(Asn)/Glu-tRNA(Gln) amidotransferase subunit GatB [Thermotogota bacterium]MCL5032084.1 Asp-tRNA(Asn)/Glu-tRNA(Gln) amidotransferase subunit GatB [Thermotogota bacterium]